MKIEKIRINNFRLLKNTIIDFEKELSLIIGKNNCGKTSVLIVIDKFLGSQSITNTFSYDDFNLDFKEDLWKLINHVIKWDDILVPGIALYIYIQCENEDNLSNIEKLMLDLDPKNKTVVIKYEYFLNLDSYEQLANAFHEYNKKHKDIDAKQLFDTFMKNKHRKYFHVRRKSVFYDIYKDEINEINYREIDSKIVDLRKIISFKYISARRDTSNAENDNTLSCLSSKYYERATDKEESTPILENFEDMLSNTDNELSNIYEDLFSGVLDKIKKFGGIRENETAVKIVSTIRKQQLIKGNTTVVYEDQGQLLPETYNGLGYLNLISIIFEIETILSCFREDNDETKKPSDINLLFIEEPEAHTHPQMQYVFINNIKNILREGSSGSEGKKSINLQTVITTHSSHIVSECNFDDVKYLYKQSVTEVVSKNLKDLVIKYRSEKNPEKNHYKFLKHYLTLNRAEIFFADKCILFEGDTERILLPAMMKKIDQNTKDKIPLLSQNITLMEVGNYSHIFDEFLKFIGVKTLIITDLDAAKKEQTGVSNEGEPIYTLKASENREATHTTNGALKHYFEIPLNKTTKSQFDFFCSLNSNDKILMDTTDGWVLDNDGKMMIVYQNEEENTSGEKYIPRSFEDAFFHINREFIINDKNNFSSLKNINYFSENVGDSKKYKYSSYELARECVESKASFAMDVLLNSTYEEDGIDFSNWQIPRYIKEGMEWIKQGN